MTERGGVVRSFVSEDLNANVVELGGGEAIGEHRNDDVDVAFVVLSGSGELSVDVGVNAMNPGEVLVVDKGSTRSLAAGPDGLRYVTVHRRADSEGLTIRHAP